MADPLLRKRQRRIDYGQTFGSPHGKRVLWDILERCHIFRSSFVPAGGDATVFKEGERNIGLQIIDMLQIRTIDDLQEIAEVEE